MGTNSMSTDTRPIYITPIEGHEWVEQRSYGNDSVIMCAKCYWRVCKNEKGIYIDNSGVFCRENLPCERRQSINKILAESHNISKAKWQELVDNKRISLVPYSPGRRSPIVIDGKIDWNKSKWV